MIISWKLKAVVAIINSARFLMPQRQRPARCFFGHIGKAFVSDCSGNLPQRLRPFRAEEEARRVVNLPPSG